MKHDGTLEDLQTIVKSCGFSISELKDQEHGYQIKTSEGATVNWYTSTGTVNIQGKKGTKDRLVEAWSSYTGSNLPKSATSADEPSPEAPSNPAVTNKKVST